MTENKIINARKVVIHRAQSMHLGIIGWIFIGTGLLITDLPNSLAILVGIFFEIAGYFDFRKYVRRMSRKEEK